ncbi:MAG: hypothetical protein ACYTGB_14710, partial [Planctomycetota bacterium]
MTEEEDRTTPEPEQEQEQERELDLAAVAEQLAAKAREPEGDPALDGAASEDLPPDEEGDAGDEEPEVPEDGENEGEGEGDASGPELVSFF